MAIAIAQLNDPPASVAAVARTATEGAELTYQFAASTDPDSPTITHAPVLTNGNDWVRCWTGTRPGIHGRL